MCGWIYNLVTIEPVHGWK